MSGYTKLFSSIIHSTIWREPPHIKVVWVTMLALADQDGEVNASIPGLADAARVSIPECEEALQLFMSPDPYSRTPDNDGRRIEPVPGGWKILNHGVYRELQSAADIRAKAAERQKRYRENQAKRVTSRVTESDGSNDIAEAYTEAEAKEEKNNTPLPPKGGKRGGRVPAWKQEYPEPVTEAVIEILTFWPQDGKGHLQPTRDGSIQDVPHTIAPTLAERLASIHQQGGDMQACVAIARRFVEEWQRREHWMKAAQFFFGVAPDAPWQGYYRAHMTNAAMSQRAPQLSHPHLDLDVQ